MRVLIAAGGTAGHINRHLPLQVLSKRQTLLPRSTLPAARRAWSTVW